MSSDPTQNTDEAADQDSAKLADTDKNHGPTDEQTDPTAPAGSEASDPVVEELRAQITELTDQILRARAETENVRRRATRDVENAHKFALEKFAGELLPVTDSLEKAVEVAEQSAEGANAEAVRAIADGVSLSLKLFLDKLAKGGIEAIDPLGEPFDPQRHEAMAMVPNPDAEPNTVMDVMQKGYVLNGRLVRAARVVVVKSPDA
ncbi:MAG: nucleotide exchange factor GrpE [Pseudomonadota bacterium]